LLLRSSPAECPKTRKTSWKKRKTAGDELPCPPIKNLEQAAVGESRPGEAAQHTKQSEQKEDPSGGS
jgi:hypothetical protein